MTGPLHRLNEGILALRASMTAGQRVTAGLAAALGTAILLFGAPGARVISSGLAPTRSGAVVGTSPAVSTGSVGASGYSSPGGVTAGPALDGMSPPSGAGSAGRSSLPAPPAGPSPAPAATGAPETPAGPLGVVGLVRDGDGPPGRDDAAMARAFLPGPGLATTFVSLGGPTAATCGAVERAGPVVVSGLGLPADLRACLVAAGETIVSYDDLGDLPPAGGHEGQVISSSRGIRASLVDTGRWGLAAGVLRGVKVGLVAASAHRSQVDAAARTLRHMGMHIAGTAYIDAGDPGRTQVAEGVSRFSGMGVQVVVFSLPVQQQGAWAGVASVLQAHFRYVVSDADDSVVNESYPPAFDGALAYTAVRVPWYARSHSATPEQVGCQQEWQRQAQVTLDSQELAHVFIWCLHAALVREAVARGGGDGAAFGRTVRGLRVPSPLTSDLEPLRDGGFGPGQDGVLVWRASCGCWSERQGLTERGD